MHLSESRSFGICTAKILVLSAVSPKVSWLLGKETAHNCLKLRVSDCSLRSFTYPTSWPNMSYLHKSLFVGRIKNRRQGDSLDQQEILQPTHLCKSKVDTILPQKIYVSYISLWFFFGGGGTIDPQCLNPVFSLHDSQVSIAKREHKVAPREGLNFSVYNPYRVKRLYPHPKRKLRAGRGLE